MKQGQVKLQNSLISIIIPVYNEEEVIGDCLKSLLRQSYKPLEIIIVDDGSTDGTIKKILKFNVKVLKQLHKGPGSARNLGSKKAKGEILVFVDADMTFDKNFIRDLVSPILAGKTIGTFSRNEMVKNSENIWSICWNINRNVPPERMLPVNYPDKAPVFRAILKKEFDKVGGFDVTGEYTDDWSLSRKLNTKSTVASGAVYYHMNPSSILEVWKQTRWIGKNEFISGTLLRRLKSVALYSIPFSIVIAFSKSLQKLNLHFFIFKLIYDFAVFNSVLRSFLKEAKYK